MFSIIQARLVYLAMQDGNAGAVHRVADIALTAARPRILDRNGEVLALDIEVQSLYAEPKLIENPDETYEALITVLPDLDFDDTMKRLKSGQGFVWLKRELTPRQQADILALGLPGIGFRPESKRLLSGSRNRFPYSRPHQYRQSGHRRFRETSRRSLACAICITLAFNSDKDLEPVQLSIDLRVQHFVREALAEGDGKIQGDCRCRRRAERAYRRNCRACRRCPITTPTTRSMRSKRSPQPHVCGPFEMGSTFKTFTTAMALDSGKVTLRSRFDARKPIRSVAFTINDFHGKKRILSVPEVFIYSSNIGTAKMADTVGIQGHRRFLTKIGLLTK